MFPIRFKDDRFKEPSNTPAYFVVAANGVLLVKDMDLYRACVRVEGIPWYEPQPEYLELKIPRIPRELVEACVGFFYAVYDDYRSESIVVLYFSPADRRFRVEIPRQRVSRHTYTPSHFVQYDIPPTPEGFIKLGTWHSHANLRACHSSQDDDDESTQDGLHLVTGDLSSWLPSFSFSFVVSGRRFLLREEDVIEGYQNPKVPVPAEWMEQVEWLQER